MPADVMKMLTQPHRKANYFFVFVEKGSLTHKVDLKDLAISDGQLFFVLPNQIHAAPAHKNIDIEYFKMSFDQNCLSLLPKQFLFLLNPLNLQIISFNSDSKQRVKILFEILNKILHSENEQKDAEIILAHLNSLLTEFNNAYFKGVAIEKSETNKLSKYIEFKIAVETHLTEQHTIHTICLLYTSDAADERSSVDLGGRRIIKKKNKNKLTNRTTIHKKYKKKKSTQH